ncbi:MAG: hypothetical protein KZQ76_03350 [Candidatus Thiodiazotropha sp. (ex Epidulcina cf. delphinae)]|nr:hypothetical protein [Candidatus Thiodiazotropha sp. (ex Epidulcina cf. delphinae)]
MIVSVVGMSGGCDRRMEKTIRLTLFLPGCMLALMNRYLQTKMMTDKRRLSVWAFACSSASGSLIHS